MKLRKEKEKEKIYNINIANRPSASNPCGPYTPFPFCGSAPLYRFGQHSCPIRLA